MDTSLIGVLRQLVEQYTNWCLFESAQFYAERLYYEFPSPDTVYLLAQVFYRQGKIKQTYLLLHGCDTFIGRYLLAVVCIALKKYKEAEKALLPTPTKASEINGSLADTIPGGASGLYLLGYICRIENRRDTAIAYYQASLQVEPTLWQSICDLSEMGVIVDTSSLFGIDIATAIKHFGVTEGTAASYVRSAHTTSASAATPSRSSDMIEVLEHRRIAESPFMRAVASSPQRPLTGGPQETPSASMSLGMSSLSLRQPFVSPMSMNMVPASLHRFELQGINESSIDNSANISTKPRVLFDMSPGLTPIGNVQDVGLVHTNPHHHQARHLANTGMSDIIPSGGHTVPSTNSNYLHRGGGMYSATNTPDMGDGFRGGRLGFGTEETHSHEVVSGAHGVAGTRRVSFGPTARLSFSSSMGLDPFANSNGLPSSSQGVSSASHHPSSRHDTVSTDMFGIPEADDIDDSYPSKVLRMNESNADYSSEFDPKPNLFYSGEISPTAAGYPVDNDIVSLSAFRDDPSFTASHSAGPSANATSGAVSTRPIDDKRSQADSSLFSIKSNAVDENTPIDSNRDTAFNKGTQQQQQQQRGVSSGLDIRGDNATNVDLSTIATTTVTGIQKAASLLCIFATAYQSISFYRCVECITILHSLPIAHFKSGWVQHLVGKAYYELCDYKPALLSLKEMIRLEPFRVKGVEILSTVLWHLKREKELCALAQQIVEIDKQAPESWCVVGNCFSLQRETDAAIKYFQRALQIDNRFVYAHTLCGHELVNNEDLDKAIACFRMALLHDDRHYNAWYGLGSIYFRQEKHEMAELHFRRAIAVNPISSVLKCYLSMVLHAQGRQEKTTEALQLLLDASTSDPKNPQLHFQRAHILYSTVSDDMEVSAIEEILEECEQELLVVAELAPREPPIYAMLGQIYQRLGRVQDALRNYNIAMDLDPKEAASLKAALDSL